MRFSTKLPRAVAVVVALALFALYYANWQFGWVSVDDLDFYNPPENAAR